MRLIAAAAALTVVLDGALLVARSGDDGDDDVAVLGARVERTTTTAAAPTTSTTAVATPGAVDAPTSSIAILDETGATTSTTGRPFATTTTAPSTAPRQVTERSDNTASFTYGPGSGTPITVVQGDPADPFRFLVQAQDGDQDGTAELKTQLANQTQREVRFPGGLVLRFTFARDGKFWRTVELKFADVEMLPARGSLEIESAVELGGPGRYDVVGETVVEYR